MSLCQTQAHERIDAKGVVRLTTSAMCMQDRPPAGCFNLYSDQSLWQQFKPRPPHVTLLLSIRKERMLEARRRSQTRDLDTLRLAVLKSPVLTSDTTSQVPPLPCEPCGCGSFCTRFLIAAVDSWSLRGLGERRTAAAPATRRRMGSLCMICRTLLADF